MIPDCKEAVTGAPGIGISVLLARPARIVALSGGKDSTVMALELKEREPDAYEFCYTPTGRELPAMLRTLEAARMSARSTAGQSASAVTGRTDRQIQDAPELADAILHAPSENRTVPTLRALETTSGVLCRNPRR